MKYSALALAAVVGTASAGKPTLSISVQDGKFDGLDGLDPTLNWEGSASSGDLSLDYGIEAAVRPTADIASLPRNVWGKASTNIAGWGVSAKAENDMSGSTDIEVDAENGDLNIHLTASAAGGVDVHSVEATQTMDVDGATVTINPRYNMDTEEADVRVGYSNKNTDVTLTASKDDQEVNIKHNMGDTTLDLTASADNQEVTVSQQLDNTNVKLTASADSQEVVVDHQMDNTNVKLTASADNQEVVVDHSMGDTNLLLTASADAQELTIKQQLDKANVISPTINSNGDMSVAWERDLGDGNSLTANMKPDDSLNVEWKDNDWTANIDMPMKGYDITGASVSVKRDVSF